MRAAGLRTRCGRDWIFGEKGHGELVDLYEIRARSIARGFRARGRSKNPEARTFGFGYLNRARTREFPKVLQPLLNTYVTDFIREGGDPATGISR